jgi:hypothetical protein
MNNKRGGYVLSDSDSDSSEYRRHKKNPSVSFVDVKSLFTSTNDTEGLFLCLLYSDESESESDKTYSPLLLLMFASVFTEVLICCLLYSNESEESDESDEYFSTFGDEWSDRSDCNSDSSDCYGSDNGYPRTRPRKVNINMILTRPKFLQNRRRKFMPISVNVCFSFHGGFNLLSSIFE